ncbi:hypothetical protein [Lactococcus chungangensis]|uniref:hypothetical protein n=1 Tax=Pseudolactococcus chungangensis TaxID=451457 RepID=UPI003735EF0C
MNPKTDFLITRPSVLRGISKIIDLGAVSSHKYNSSKNSEEADYRALKNDWLMTGKDMKDSLNEFKKENAEYVK